MEEPLFPDVPGGLTEAAKQERQRFLEQYQKMMDAAKSVALTVLVWGPGQTSASPLARKREDIREELIRRGHNAMFSEEIPVVESELSEKSKEYAQAKSAHLVCVLPEDSPGALAETHDFCNDPAIAPKMFLLIPKKYAEGYSAKGAVKDFEEAYGSVYWYEAEDVVMCNLLKKTVRRVEALRNIFARHGGLSE